MKTLAFVALRNIGARRSMGASYGHISSFLSSFRSVNERSSYSLNNTKRLVVLTWFELYLSGAQPPKHRRNKMMKWNVVFL